MGKPILLLDCLFWFECVCRYFSRGFCIHTSSVNLTSFCSNSLPDQVKRSDIVSAALFRDAASAAVVGGNTKEGETSCYEILAGKSLILGDESKRLVDYS